MLATQANFLELIRQSPQFVIPIYQRTYSWTDQECRQLWDDILRTGDNYEVPTHFVGSIVYIESTGPKMLPSPQVVIDGQQRLTTMSLLIAALAKALENLP